ncbi:MAG: MGH1-like glycoside hydrolase domain-containing protein [Candidatus Limnocylindrales bacterium]
MSENRPTSHRLSHTVGRDLAAALRTADDLLGTAREVLDANWTGRYTRPSQALYPHQWSWDSAFIAVGRAWHDAEGARQELETLLEAQWETGMVPSIVFDAEAPPDAYFPGPDVWQSERSPAAPRGRPTSGITQPPIHARAALEVHRHAPPDQRTASLAWLGRLYPKLVAQQRYLAAARDPGGSGLAAIVHPWESGLDDSPAWDRDFERIEVPPAALPPYRRRDLARVAAADRPTDADYGRFLYLLMLERGADYDDARVVATSPFLMVDPLFNAIRLWSEHALAEIAELTGSDPAPHRAAARRLHEALIGEQWVAKRHRFCAWDLRRDQREPEDTIVSFVPLLDPDLPPAIVTAICRELESPSFHPRAGGLHFIVPTHDERAADFDPERYWRGPVWLNTNWLLWRGLRQHGRTGMADEIVASSVELVRRAGFREYFDPLDGTGHGSDRFSWSAALLTDMVLTSRRSRTLATTDRVGGRTRT